MAQLRGPDRPPNPSPELIQGPYDFVLPLREFVTVNCPLELAETLIQFPSC